MAEAAHDRINLGRLVRRLETSVEANDLSAPAGDAEARFQAWLTMRGMQQVKNELYSPATYSSPEPLYHRKLRMQDSY
jgi:hypothetical protein